MTNGKEYSRLNFFDGMFATATDWNEAHNFHVTKLRQHNRLLHKAGVIHGFLGDFKVRPSDDPQDKLGLVIEAGAAIDGDGNLIYLAQAHTKLSLKGKAADTYYVAISFGETASGVMYNDPRFTSSGKAPQANGSAPTEYLGHTRMDEDPILEITTDLPDNKTKLELARIVFSGQATELKPYVEGHHADSDQINLRNVQETTTTHNIDEKIKKLRHDLTTDVKKLNEVIQAVRVDLTTQGTDLSEDIKTLDKEFDDKTAKLKDDIIALEDHLHLHTKSLEDNIIAVDGKLDTKVGELSALIDQLNANITLQIIDLGNRHDEDLVRTTRALVQLGDNTDSAIGSLNGLIRDVQNVFDGHVAELGVILTDLDNRTSDLAARVNDLQDYTDRLDSTASTLSTALSYASRDGKVHLRGAHTPGVLQEGEKLLVKEAGGLRITILPGAAIDNNGNTVVLAQARTLTVDLNGLHLPQDLYVAIQYNADDPTQPEVGVMTTLNTPWVELARIYLRPGVTQIQDATYPATPGDNQINLLHVPVAGAIALREPGMSKQDVDYITQVMDRTRSAFASLDSNFPIPSNSDARHVAMSVATLARIGRLSTAQMADLLATALQIQQDVSQELDVKYSKILTSTAEFDGYLRSVRDLHEAIGSRDADAILIAQDGVAAAANRLSQVVIAAPVANAGRDQIVTSYRDHYVVTLDASLAEARGERTIKEYRWTISAS